MAAMTTTGSLLPGPLWLAGCGNMGGAMLSGWIADGVDPKRVSVIRPSGRAVGHGIRVTGDWPEDEVPAIVLLAMKPHQLDAAAPGLAPILDANTLLISILAGVELASLRARFAAPRTIVRAMPNLPVAIGKGVIGLASDSDDLEARALATALMAMLGHAEWFAEEASLDLVTALAGSGPAFAFRFIAALAEAGAALGMDAAAAQRLAIATVEGSAALAAGGTSSLDALARRVTSPNGTTAAGLAVLDPELPDLVGRTLAAARRRAMELGAQARGD